MTLEQQLKTKAQTKMLESHQASMKATLEEYVSAQEEVRKAVNKMNELRTVLYYMEKQQDSITDDLIKELNAQEDSSWSPNEMIKLREIFTAYDAYQGESVRPQNLGEDKIDSELSFVPTMATMIPMVKMLGTLEELYKPYIKEALKAEKIACTQHQKYRGQSVSAMHDFDAMVKALRAILYNYNNFGHFMNETAQDLIEEPA